MSARRRLGPHPAALVAVLGVVASARGVTAQVVTGQVVSASSGAAVENAVVVLLDSARRQLGGALTDAAGAFALRAPAAGRYWVRAERVGSASATAGPVATAVGDTTRVRLTLAEAPRLQAVRVTARERCRVRPEAGALAARLWDAVRTALEGTALARDRGAFPFSLERFERTLDPGDRHLVREERWLTPAAREPFASAPAEELRRLGWVRLDSAAGAAPSDESEQESAGTRFYGPDARVLLSDPFVDAHCLRAVEAPAARAGQVGLAFEPVPNRRPRLPDVRGTLWLDTATSELRDLEFEYTDLPRLVARHHPGGAIAFARTPNGVWYVARWALRMPVLLRTDLSFPPVLASVREVGGRTLREEELARVPPDVALVNGIVVDSTDDLRPMAGVRVSVVGRPYGAITDSLGRFRLELPDSGTATIALAHPRLTALGVRPATAAPVVLGRETVLPLAFPSGMTIRRQLCGAGGGDTTVAVVGAIWDPAPPGQRPVADVTAPRRGATVDVEWRQGAGAAARTERRTVRTDAAGHFHACALPADVELTLRPPAIRAWRVGVPRGGIAVLEWVLVRGPVRGGNELLQRVDR